MSLNRIVLLLSCMALTIIYTAAIAQRKTGDFENNTDVGAVLHKGSEQFTPATGTYLLS
ncbi:MAG: hypothetical protein ICV84_20245, partial [Flavisolibacter sp.]|nr:hypothetical protein [Flavisolibacter sp.]